MKEAGPGENDNIVLRVPISLPDLDFVNPGPISKTSDTLNGREVKSLLFEIKGGKEEFIEIVKILRMIFQNQEQPLLAFNGEEEEEVKVPIDAIQYLGEYGIDTSLVLVWISRINLESIDWD